MPAGGSCHDISVILGDAMRAACSGGTGFRMFSLGGPSGGSLTFPELLYRVDVPTVTVGHSTAFTWNGEIFIFGHEPGGGVAAQCEASDPAALKSFYFYRTSDGALLGTWVLPRGQAANENCTLHNFNVVPFLDRYVMTHGSYQAGTGVVDFTNPAAAVEVAYSDPPPEPVPAPGPAGFCTPSPPGCALGGAWATYWYNDYLYETNISEGLNVWDVNESWWESALELPHMNPQTQEDTMECSARARGVLRAGRRGSVRINVRVLDQGVAGLRVRLRGPGINRTLTTNASGVATASVRPTRRGTLRANVRRTLNMDGCSATRRIAAAPRRPRAGSGTAGTGTGGAALAGRVQLARDDSVTEPPPSGRAAVPSSAWSVARYFQWRKAFQALVNVEPTRPPSHQFSPLPGGPQTPATELRLSVEPSTRALAIRPRIASCAARNSAGETMKLLVGCHVKPRRPAGAMSRCRRAYLRIAYISSVT